MNYSVAMCSFNGEKYISAQIESILKQTVPVSEIVICDDGSTDSTIDIIRNIKNKTFINISLIENELSLGVRGNFMKALSLCKGDIIFLSDQDDIWAADKVEKVRDWFDDNPQKDVVFTNAFLADETGAPMGYHSQFESVWFTKKARRGFDLGYGLELFLNFNRATGATMALRQTFLHYLDNLSFKSPEFYHDSIISIMAISLDKLGYIDEKLIFYRQHEGQVAGMSINKGKKEAEFYLSPFFSHPSLGEYVVEGYPRVEFAKFRQKMVYKKDGAKKLFARRHDYKIYYKNKWCFAFAYDLMVNLKYCLSL